MDEHESFKVDVLDEAEDLDAMLARETAIFAIVVTVVLLGLIYWLK